MATWSEADMWRTVAAVKALGQSYNQSWDHAKQVQIATQILKGQRTLGSVRDDVKNRLAGNRPGTPGGGVNNDTASGPVTTPGSGSGGGSSSGGSDEPESRDFRQEVRLLFPWMPSDLVRVYADAWEEYGDPNLALAAMRQDNRYDRYFPGNRREDGSIIASEGEYLSVMEGYDRRMASFGLNPADFTQKKIQAFQNGRSPDEVEADIGKVYLGIATRGEEYRQYYARKYGTGDISNTALLASALDTSTSPLEFERRIRAAQVGGAAATFGFDIARQEAERLESFGLQDEAARTLYARAKGELPVLQNLVARWNDPDDPLTVEDFADAIVLKDPDELARFGRLFARERSQYSATGVFAADQSGAQRGILSR